MKPLAWMYNIRPSNCHSLSHHYDYSYSGLRMIFRLFAFSHNASALRHSANHRLVQVLLRMAHNYHTQSLNCFSWGTYSQEIKHVDKQIHEYKRSSPEKAKMNANEDSIHIVGSWKLMEKWCWVFALNLLTLMPQHCFFIGELKLKQMKTVVC